MEGNSQAHPRTDEQCACHARAEEARRQRRANCHPSMDRSIDRSLCCCHSRPSATSKQSHDRSSNRWIQTIGHNNSCTAIPCYSAWAWTVHPSQRDQSRFFSLFLLESRSSEKGSNGRVDQENQGGNACRLQRSKGQTRGVINKKKAWVVIVLTTLLWHHRLGDGCRLPLRLALRTPRHGATRGWCDRIIVSLAAVCSSGRRTARAAHAAHGSLAMAARRGAARGDRVER